MTPPESLTLLELSDISKTYRGTAGAADTPVLRGVNLRLAEKETVALVGPSGSGKSTLLNIIGTLDRPDSGRVTLNGKDLTALSDEALARVRSREIGLIFQSHHLLPQCTVLENVLVPTLAFAGEPRTEAPEARAARLLTRVGLSHRLHHRPGQLSGGERQRVAVVRAMINEPKLLLADEPTGALDQKAADTLADLLIELNREENVAVLVITHSLKLAERMTRIYEMREGAVFPQ